MAASKHGGGVLGSQRRNGFTLGGFEAMQRAIDETYRQRGVYAGGVEQFPTFFDVRDWLRPLSG